MSAKRYLPSDVSLDIHQIIAKAIFLHLVKGHNPMIILPRSEMEDAAEAEFEYDILDDGSILFRPAQDA